MNRYMIEQVAARLQASAMRIARDARRGEKEGRLGPSRLSALAILATSEPLSLAELAAADRVRAPTMSRTVDAMVRDGLVTRETVPTDRRSVRIAVTAEGRAALDRERRGHLKQLADRLERLGESEQRALQRGVDLLEQVTARL